MTRAIASVRRRRRRQGDRGYTLVELLVSMSVFAILLALVAAATMSMFQSLWRQTGQTDNLDSSRKVISLLDKQVRYANAINTPVTGTDGAFYVEWRSGNADQQQTCYQWRWVPSTKLLQFRTWKPPLFGSGSSPASGWVTEANGVYQSGSTPLFSISPDPYAVASLVSTSHELLTVMFISTHGKPAKSTTSKVSLTGANTTSSTAPSGVCQENGHP